MAERADFYTIRFSADPVQLIFFRHGLSRWLEGLDWPEAERVDVILAVSEACSNAVQHAYPAAPAGDVEVVGRLVVGKHDRHVVVVVRDWGAWQQNSADRGYGLTTVRACMAKVRIRREPTGTLVTMTSRSVPMAGEGAVPTQRRSVEPPERHPRRLRQI